MKRIIVLCDGTWNRADSKTPTNVVQISQAIRPIDDEGVVQVPLYIQGVGTGEGITVLSRWLDKILGGALGWGLTENIVEAYRHLIFLYEPGDEIYIFGYSRGAYTARALGGFIRSTGIITRDNLQLIPKAVKRYRARKGKSLNPRSDFSKKFRANDMQSCVATDSEENTWRRENGIPEAPLLKIAYLGIWDCVGALGIPQHIPVLGRLTAKRYEFHDTKLSSMVASARHAIALDERRRTFQPTRWETLEDLNNCNTDSSKDTPLYQELFFAGDHSSVGGGGDIVDLSSIALDWIMDGAADAGLAFDKNRRSEITSQNNPCGPLSSQRTVATGLGEWITRRKPLDREGPKNIDEMHSSTMTRFVEDESYRPKSLAHVQAALETRIKNETDSKKDKT